MRWKRQRCTKAKRGAINFKPLSVASGLGNTLLQEDRFSGGPASPLIFWDHHSPRNRKDKSAWRKASGEAFGGRYPQHFRAAGSGVHSLV